MAKRLDRELLTDLRTRSAADAVVLLNGRDVVFSTLDDDATRRLVAASSRARRPGHDRRVDGPGRPAGQRPAVDDRGRRARTRATRPGPMLFVLILLGGALFAGVLVAVVARGLSQPYTEIADAAERVAGGDLDTSITPATDGEAGRLGERVQPDDRRAAAEHGRAGAQPRGPARHPRTHRRHADQHPRPRRAAAGRARDRGGHPAGPVRRRAVGRRPTGCSWWRSTAWTRRACTAPAVVDARDRSARAGRLHAARACAAGSAPGRPSSSRSAGEPDDGRGAGRRRCAAWATSSASSRCTTGSTAGRSTPADEDALRTLAGQASIAVDNVQLHHEAQRLSTTDPLTGLWNFRYLSMSLAREIERSTRFDRPLAVLMLDLDHFKLVNDTLRPRARRLGAARAGRTGCRSRSARSTPSRATAARSSSWSSRRPRVEGAAQLAERICVAVRREPFRSEGEEPLDVTVSIGGAAFPDHGASAATLMRAADKALYVAKGEGRDRWHVPDGTD